MGEGIVLDPFAGAGSTLAAAEAVGYRSIGVEIDEKYVGVARGAIPKLVQLKRSAMEVEVDEDPPSSPPSKKRNGRPQMDLHFSGT